MYRILLVTADLKAANELENSLGGVPVSIERANSLQDALRRLNVSTYDLIVTDTLLPDGEAIPVLSLHGDTRGAHRPPVVIFTQDSSLESKLRAFSHFVEDYIVRPIDGRELSARLTTRMLIARNRSIPAEAGFRVGCVFFALHTLKAYLSCGTRKRDLNLTPAEFKIFLLFARNPGRTLTGQEILRELWSQDIHVIQRTVYTHIYSLRKKLGSASKCLKSLKGGGYVFWPCGFIGTSESARAS